MKILVVDDDKRVLLKLSEKLKGKGYNVFVTDNGVESFQIISEKKIDLVISDVRMPCLSGFTIITMLKNFYFINIPVILMSSSKQKVELLNLYGVEKRSFFSKPINFARLLKRIKECSKNKVRIA